MSRTILHHRNPRFWVLVFGAASVSASVGYLYDRRDEVLIAASTFKVFLKISKSILFDEVDTLDSRVARFFYELAKNDNHHAGLVRSGSIPILCKIATSEGEDNTSCNDAVKALAQLARNDEAADLILKILGVSNIVILVSRTGAVDLLQPVLSRVSPEDGLIVPFEKALTSKSTIDALYALAKSFPTSRSIAAWPLQVTDSSGKNFKKNFGPWLRSGVDGVGLIVVAVLHLIIKHHEASAIEGILHGSFPLLEASVTRLVPSLPPLDPHRLAAASLAINTLKLYMCVNNGFHAVELSKVNWLQRLLSLSLNSNGQFQLTTLAALRHITQVESFQNIFISDGGLATLAKICSDSTNNFKIQKSCASILRNILLQVDSTLKPELKETARSWIPQMLIWLKSKHPELQLSSLDILRGMGGEIDNTSNEVLFIWYTSLLASAINSENQLYKGEISSAVASMALSLSEQQPEVHLDSNEWVQVKEWTATDDENLQLIAAKGISALAAHAPAVSNFLASGGLLIVEKFARQCDPEGEWGGGEGEGRVHLRRLVAKIIADLSASRTPESSAQLSGHWILDEMEKWSVSDPKIFLETLRAKANLSAGKSDPVYEDGIYLVSDTAAVRERYRGEGRGIIADVIFIHGLKGGAVRSWKIEGDEWPWHRMWLTQDHPNVRIISIEFDSHLTVLFGGGKGRSLAEIATNFRKRLRAAQVGSRPIVFVTYSMGGLVAKKLIADALADAEDKDIVEQTAGVVFIATPHRGSWIARLGNTNAIELLQASATVKDLAPSAPHLSEIDAAFRRLNIPVLSFGEELGTRIPSVGISAMIVPEESSNPGYGEYHLVPGSDHFSIAKPASRDSLVYSKTCQFISRVLRERESRKEIREGPFVLDVEGNSQSDFWARNDPIF